MYHLAGKAVEATVACILRCCGGSKTLYRRWCPCEQPGCWPGHLPIWIPDTIPPVRPCMPNCHAGVVVIGNGSDRWCYYCADGVLPLDQIPPGSQIIGVNVSPAAINCDLTPAFGCNDPVCNPTGEPGPCPCACENACFVLDYSGGTFDIPPSPGDPPCAICCWARNSMSYSLYRIREEFKTLEVYIPGFCLDGVGPALCNYTSNEVRAGRLLTPADPGWGFGCEDPCCRCYKMELRDVRVGCNFPQIDIDTGWVEHPFNVLQLCPESPGPPVDTGWVDIGSINVCSQPPGGPNNLGVQETRYEYTASCGGYVAVNSEHYRTAGTCGGGGVACMVDERYVNRERHTQVGSGSACCGGCKQEICGGIVSGGGCPNVFGPYPIDIPPGGGIGGDGGLQPGGLRSSGGLERFGLVEVLPNVWKPINRPAANVKNLFPNRQTTDRTFARRAPESFA